MIHMRWDRATAIIAMRYDATEFSQRATEVLAYGTAVRPELSQGHSVFH